MKSLVVRIDQGNYSLSLIDKPIPELNFGECLVKMRAAALNRRDYWISVGKYPGIKNLATLGSDGCGLVIEGSEKWKGKTVLINPNINWGNDLDVQGVDYSILGTPEDGTFGEYLVVPEHRLVEKPGHLSEVQGAALPLAGLTAYRAVFNKGKIDPGSKVLVTGVGGGVSHYALMFALKLGASVYVTSSSQQKLDKAKALGALQGFNYQDSDWGRKALGEVGKFDVIIDSAGGDAINDYLRIVKPGGRIVVYGSTTGKTDGLDLFRLFWSQVSLVGSTMGNDQEFHSMIGFVAEHKIIPVIDREFSFDQSIKAVEGMSSNQQFGKTIIRF